MKVIFRGVRGSIPVPGKDTVRYGGNTTCIQIDTNDGDLIILDGGSGIRNVGNELLSRLPVKCSVFITHTHWDHIQGLPFFLPLFIPGNQIDFYGAFDPVYGRNLKSILSQQMEYCYFPVRENELKATITYTDLREGQSIQIGNTKISCILMNHPVLNYGYRIDADGKSLFFTGDHEPGVNIYAKQDEEYEEYQAMIDSKDKMITDFIKNVDLLITDSMYSQEEYPDKIGWGHGTPQSSLCMAQQANVKKLLLTHHDPMRTDDDLDRLAQNLTSTVKSVSALTLEIAREGKVVEV